MRIERIYVLCAVESSFGRIEQCIQDVDVVVDAEFRVRQMAGGDLPVVVAAAENHGAVEADGFNRAAGGLHVQLLQARGPVVERAEGGKPA